jgi:hypothetical protein
MADDTGPPEPHHDVPDAVRETLQDLNDAQLRHTAEYVQRLLNYHQRPVSEEVEAGPGEEILRVDDHDVYTEVVKKQPCADDCPDCPHGPYLYHVIRETHPDGDRRLHWSYVGRVSE